MPNSFNGSPTREDYLDPLDLLKFESSQEAKRELDYNDKAGIAVPNKDRLYEARGMILSDKLLDFGHFIASLAYQISSKKLPVPNSDVPDWLSWAGDIGSAVESYVKTDEQKETIIKSLDKNASETDYIADVAAYIVGKKILSGKKYVDAIKEYNSVPYKDHVIEFIEEKLGGKVENKILKNPADVDLRIRKSVASFIALRPPVSNSFSLITDSLINERAVSIGSLHFLIHLMKNSGLEPVEYYSIQ